MTRLARPRPPGARPRPREVLVPPARLDARPAPPPADGPPPADRVRAALAALDPADRRVVERVHGLAGPPLALAPAAARLGLTLSDANDRYRRAFGRLSDLLGGP